MIDDPDKKLDLVEELFEGLGIDIDEKRAAMINQAPQLIPQLESAIAEINRKLQIARDFLGQCDDAAQNFDTHKSLLPSVIGRDFHKWYNDIMPIFISHRHNFSEWILEWADEGSEIFFEITKIWNKINKKMQEMWSILCRFKFSSNEIKIQLFTLEALLACNAIVERDKKLKRDIDNCSRCTLQRNRFWATGSKLKSVWCSHHESLLYSLYDEHTKLRSTDPAYSWVTNNYRKCAESMGTFSPDELRQKIKDAQQRELVEPGKIQLEVEPILDEIKEQIILLRNIVVTRIQELELELAKRRIALDAVLAAISG